ncbi:MAG TPA: amidohydrolase family protein [Bryobacteraceae bacterium]|jgi:enamidase
MDRYRKFLTLTSLLFAAPLPLTICLLYQMGGWRSALESPAGEIVLALCYWFPIGALLSFYQGRTWKRLLFGYLLSLPLYFLTLKLIYPIWGGATFHPLAHGHLAIYLTATPSFFGMVRLVYFLSTSRVAHWTRGAATLACAAGICAPIYLAASTNMRWPNQPGNLVITGAHIVDPSADRIIDGQNIYISDGRIVEISPATLHPGWPRLDAQNRWLMAGLIDVHTHIQSPVEIPVGFRFGYFMRSMMGRYGVQRGEYLASGITAVRDLGGSADDNFRLRADILAKKTLGPRFFTSGRLVTSPHGHPVSTIWPEEVSWNGAILATNEADLITELDRNFAAGPPDAVKIIHGTIGRAKEELSPELMAVAVRWADRHHLMSIVHAETAQEDEDALRSGATGIEHSAYLQAVPDSLRVLIVQRHPFIDPTFGEVETDRNRQKLPAAEKERLMQLSYRAVRELYQAGARMAIGTDAPMVRYGAGFHDELDHFERAGFSCAEILTFATVNNAAYLAKPAELGRIAAGYRADLVLANANPLEKLSSLRHPVWTMLDGQIVFRGQ